MCNTSRKRRSACGESGRVVRPDMKNAKNHCVLLLLLLMAPGAWAANPVAFADSATTAEDVAVTIDVLLNDVDPDGDPKSVASIDTPPSNGSVVNNGGDVTYTPDPDFFGVDSFEYRLTDSSGGTGRAFVTVTVTSVPDSPVAVDDNIPAFAEDGSVAIKVLTNDTDADGDSLTAFQVTGPANGTLTPLTLPTSGEVTYTPNPDFNGTDLFTYQVTDCGFPMPGCVVTNVATVTFTVTPINDDPVALDDLASTDEDTSVPIDVLSNDSDVDLDTLSISAVGTPSNGTAAINGLNIDYMPALNFNGTDSFTYEVDDGNGGTASATVTVTVDPINDDPV
ncbi:MAG: tandem-95 repeat protein, partial [Gammaproteobacteria bacterium]